MWDAEHVRMPHSSRNLQRVAAGAGQEPVLRPKWPVIAQKLRLLACMEQQRPRKSSSTGNSSDEDDEEEEEEEEGRDGRDTGAYAQTLADTIVALNPAYRAEWDLRGLVRFLGRGGALTASERRRFFARTLPRMAALAAALPALCRAPVPLLRAHAPGAVALTRRQVACLLAHAFFCTLPRRSPPLAATSEYRAFPTINFAPLYSPRVQPCKLRFLLHYFARVTDAIFGGPTTADGGDGGSDGGNALDRDLIIVKRATLPAGTAGFPGVWTRSRAALCSATAHAAGLIEEQAGRMAMVDFANRRLGGGVLTRGSVQEEILFLVCPELLATRLLCETLADTEAVVVRGAVRYAAYAGYAASLAFAGDHADPAPAVPAGPAHPHHTVRDTTFIAIDALDYSSKSSSASSTPEKEQQQQQEQQQQEQQYSVRCITREADKAYCGFAAAGTQRPLATGNWGCGVFRGDRELKALVQLAAASRAGYPAVHYYAVDDHDGFVARFNTLVALLRAAGVTVGRLMTWLYSFASDATPTPAAPDATSAPASTATPDGAQGQQKQRSVFDHVQRCLAKATEHGNGDDVTK